MSYDKWLVVPYESVWLDCQKCNARSDESPDGEHCLECCEEEDFATYFENLYVWKKKTI